VIVALVRPSSLAAFPIPFPRGEKYSNEKNRLRNFQRGFPFAKFRRRARIDSRSRTKGIAGSIAKDENGHVVGPICGGDDGHVDWGHIAVRYSRTHWLRAADGFGRSNAGASSGEQF